MRKKNTASPKKVHKTMDKVKIKRVKRTKKEVSTKEKILGGLGVGSTLLGGLGAISAKPPQTQFVRVNESEAQKALEKYNAGGLSQTSKLKTALNKVFGIKEAKAGGIVRGVVYDQGVTTQLTQVERAQTASAWLYGSGFSQGGVTVTILDDGNNNVTNYFSISGVSVTSTNNPNDSSEQQVGFYFTPNTQAPGGRYRFALNGVPVETVSFNVRTLGQGFEGVAQSRPMLGAADGRAVSFSATGLPQTQVAYSDGSTRNVTIWNNRVYDITGVDITSDFSSSQVSALQTILLTNQPTLQTGNLTVSAADAGGFRNVSIPGYTTIQYKDGRFYNAQGSDITEEINAANARALASLFSAASGGSTGGAQAASNANVSLISYQVNVGDVINGSGSDSSSLLIRLAYTLQTNPYSLPSAIYSNLSQPTNLSLADFTRIVSQLSPADQQKYGLNNPQAFGTLIDAWNRVNFYNLANRPSGLIDAQGNITPTSTSAEWQGSEQQLNDFARQVGATVTYTSGTNIPGQAEYTPQAQLNFASVNGTSFDAQMFYTAFNNLLNTTPGMTLAQVVAQLTSLPPAYIPSYKPLLARDVKSVAISSTGQIRTTTTVGPNYGILMYGIDIDQFDGWYQVIDSSGNSVTFNAQTSSSQNHDARNQVHVVLPANLRDGNITIRLKAASGNFIDITGFAYQNNLSAGVFSSTAVNLSGATVGRNFSYTPTETMSGARVVWGVMPLGFAVDSSNGQITYNPATSYHQPIAGTYNFIVASADASGWKTKAYTLTVSPSTATATVTGMTVAGGTVSPGTLTNFTITGSGLNGATVELKQGNTAGIILSANPQVDGRSITGTIMVPTNLAGNTYGIVVKSAGTVISSDLSFVVTPVGQTGSVILGNNGGSTGGNGGGVVATSGVSVTNAVFLDSNNQRQASPAVAPGQQTSLWIYGSGFSTGNASVGVYNASGQDVTSQFSVSSAAVTQISGGQQIGLYVSPNTAPNGTYTFKVFSNNSRSGSGITLSGVSMTVTGQTVTTGGGGNGVDVTTGGGGNGGVVSQTNVYSITSLSSAAVKAGDSVTVVTSVPSQISGNFTLTLGSGANATTINGLSTGLQNNASGNFKTVTFVMPGIAAGNYSVNMTFGGMALTSSAVLTVYTQNSSAGGGVYTGATNPASPQYVNYYNNLNSPTVSPTNGSANASGTFTNVTSGPTVTQQSVTNIGDDSEVELTSEDGSAASITTDTESEVELMNEDGSTTTNTDDSEVETTDEAATTSNNTDDSEVETTDETSTTTTFGNGGSSGGSGGAGSGGGGSSSVGGTYTGGSSGGGVYTGGGGSGGSGTGVVNYGGTGSYNTGGNTGGQTQGVQAQGTTYTVKRGDTLWGIAVRFYGDGAQWRKILAANPGSLSIPGNVRTLRVGYVLTIPDINSNITFDSTTGTGGGTYTMKRGDTLWNLSQRYYGDPYKWTVLRDANVGKFPDQYHIPVGTVLVIPSLGQAQSNIQTYENTPVAPVQSDQVELVTPNTTQQSQTQSTQSNPVTDSIFKDVSTQTDSSAQNSGVELQTDQSPAASSDSSTQNAQGSGINVSGSDSSGSVQSSTQNPGTVNGASTDGGVIYKDSVSDVRDDG